MLWCCIYVISDTKSEQKMDKIPISCRIWVPMDKIRIKTEQPKFVRISCSRISIPFIPKWSLWKGDLGTFNGSHNPKSVTYRFLVNPVTTLIYIYMYIYIRVFILPLTFSNPDGELTNPRFWWKNNTCKISGKNFDVSLGQFCFEIHEILNKSKFSKCS